jgi:replicative DNA helicase
MESDYKTGGISGIQTGYYEIDRKIGGLQDGELILIGARASIGKTAIALNMAENIAREDIPVGFMSLEMSGTLLAERLLCDRASISLGKVKAGMFSESEFSRLNDAGETIYQYPLYIYDYSNASLFDLKLKARRMKRAKDIKVLFIDYISLITVAERKPHWEKVGDISRELKSLARELQIPVVALTQVNRDAEGREPSLADIRYSGSLEQDADVVIFIHRDRDSSEAKIRVAKNRQGPCGGMKLYFDAGKMRFYAESKEE